MNFSIFSTFEIFRLQLLKIKSNKMSCEVFLKNRKDNKNHKEDTKAL